MFALSFALLTLPYKCSSFIFSSVHSKTFYIFLVVFLSISFAECQTIQCLFCDYEISNKKVFSKLHNLDLCQIKVIVNALELNTKRKYNSNCWKESEDGICWYVRVMLAKMFLKVLFFVFPFFGKASTENVGRILLLALKSQNNLVNIFVENSVDVFSIFIDESTEYNSTKLCSIISSSKPFAVLVDIVPAGLFLAKELAQVIN